MILLFKIFEILGNFKTQTRNNKFVTIKYAINC